MIEIGDKLRFHLVWNSPNDARTAAEVTRGSLATYVGERQVWGHDGNGFEWAWVELAEHLASIWPYLLWEEVDPLGLAERPGQIRPAAERRWQNMPLTRVEREQAELWEFDRCHNLAAALQGAWIPDLWILRQGKEFSISGDSLQLSMPCSEVLATLGTLGNCIVERTAPLRDKRSKLLQNLWSDRARISTNDFVQTVTSLPAETLHEIVRGTQDVEFWELGLELEPTELLAAARMIGPGLAIDDTHRVLEAIRAIPRRTTASIDEFASSLGLSDASGLPYQQGYDLAIRSRERLGKLSEPIDPSGMLHHWGIEIRQLALASTHIDAIACWGPKHGPAIIVNETGQHAQEGAGRNATLAHEMCHLLFDRYRSLPLSEVLGGRTPAAAESRARAFAAEFLLPRSVAGLRLTATTNPQSTVEQVCVEYGVSREVVAWQARNSDVPLHPNVVSYLRAQVSRPFAF